MNDSQTVLLNIDTHIATITLNNPKTHNSLGALQVGLLTDYFVQVEDDSRVRVLVLKAEGERTFCSGASLSELQSGALTPQAFANMTQQLASLTVPSVCALQGNVYGGGCDLVLSCDFRIGQQGIRASIPAAKFGLCFPPTGIQRLVNLLGLSVAQQFLLAAEDFSDQRLMDVGFLTDLAGPDELDTRVDQLATKLAGFGPLALRAMKNISAQVANNGYDKEVAQRLVDACDSSADLAEGLQAAKEKRPPVFNGN